MPSNSGAQPTILHVTESMGAGVSSALLDYVANSPEYQHHLLYVERAETKTLPPGWPDAFESTAQLPSGQLRRIRAVREAAHRLKPLVLHSHSSFAGLYARLAVRNTAALQQVYTPHCYAFERLDLSTAARRAYRAAEWFLAGNTGTVAACSPREAALAKTLAKRWPTRTAVAYVPNAAPSVGARPPVGKVPPPGELLSLAGAGRLGPQKDPRFFLAAVEALRRSGQEVQASWLGGGDSKLTQELTEAGIRVTGWLPREQLFAELATTDVYLHSAAWEGFPLTVLEAAALQIATVVRGIPAFDGVDLPLRINSPEELPEIWPQLRDPLTRSDAAERARSALASNNSQSQRNALLAVYRGPAASAGQAGPLMATGASSAARMGA